MVKSCAALGCTYDWSSGKTDDANISFHKFPMRHPDLLDVWTVRIGRTAFVPTEHSRLCSRHFQRSDFNNPDAPKHRRLRDDAIPSLNLPNFPAGEGVGACVSEDPRLHATMAPANQGGFPSAMMSVASSSGMCHVAHADAEPAPREPLDWLNNNSQTSFRDTEAEHDEHSNVLWAATVEQQAPVPAMGACQAAPEESSQSSVQKQLEGGCRAMPERHHSPNILSTDSQSSDEEQPPAKKACLGTLQIDCDIDAPAAAPADGRREFGGAGVSSFQCSTPKLPQTVTTGAAREPRSLLQSNAKKRKLPTVKPATAAESSAGPPVSSARDTFWSNVGYAVRVVAEAVAFFLLTKADIARERHQMQVEQFRRALPAHSPCAGAPSCQDWEHASDIRSVHDSECEPGDVENLLEQSYCLKAEPEEVPRE